MVQIYRASKRPSKKHGHQPHTELTIDRLDQQGRGICTSHQPVVFVEGGLPGETCRVVVTAKKSRYWQARVVKVLVPAKERKEPGCEYFGRCGGCQLQHGDSDFILWQKQQALAQWLAKQLPEQAPDWSAPLVAQPYAYRRRARLATDSRGKTVQLGFRVEQGKQVLNIEHCPILTPPLQRLLTELQHLLVNFSGCRQLGHILLTDGQPQPQVLLRMTSRLNPADQALLEDFAHTQDCQVVIEYEQQQQLTLGGGQRPLTICPEPGIELVAGTDDFIQVNDGVNQQMVQQALDWLAIDKQDNVLDLFCGIGNFSLPLARRCEYVYGVEGVAEMVTHASENARRNGIENVQFLHQDLNQWAWQKLELAGQCNKVLLDPARAGAEQMAKTLAASNAQKILYISCNSATFVRDAAHLAKGYTLSRMGVMDMFPQTRHTELMALFERR